MKKYEAYLCEKGDVYLRQLATMHLNGPYKAHRQGLTLARQNVVGTIEFDLLEEIPLKIHELQIERWRIKEYIEQIVCLFNCFEWGWEPNIDPKTAARDAEYYDANGFIAFSGLS